MNDYFVNQKGVNDCGVACLNMILNMFNKKVDYDIIKNKLKIDKIGSSAYDIIKVARKYKVYGKCYKSYKLDSNSNLPLIAHTINDDIQHFVVITEILNNNLIIYDPAFGIKKMSIKEFNNIYTGVAIIFNEFELSKKNIINTKFIITITFMILLLSFLNILYSLIFSLIIDNITYISSKIIISLIAFGLSKEILNFIKNIYLVNTHIKLDLDVTLPSLKRLLLLPIEYYQKINSGQLISKLKDLAYVKEMYFNICEVLYVNVIIVFITLFSVLFLSFYIFLIIFIIIIILILSNKLFYKKQLNKNYELQINDEMITKNISDSLERIEIIKNYSKENYFINKIIYKYNKLIGKFKDVTLLYIIKDFIVKIIYLLLIVLTIILMNNLKLSNVLFVIYLEMMILDSLNELLKLEEIKSNYKCSYQRLKSFYNYKINNIKFKKLSINSLKLNNILLKKGDSLFIQGKTGSGKTTFFKNILLNKNKVIINDKSSLDINGEILKNSILYVDQKSKLFNISIFDNITLGDKLNIRPKTYNFIINKICNNKSLNYIINNRQDNISEGESKLILIAQALNRNSDVIIFDETTNGLDSKTEKDLFNIVFNEYKDKIIILISHKNANKNLFKYNALFIKGNIQNKKGDKYERIKKI